MRKLPFIIISCTFVFVSLVLSIAQQSSGTCNRVIGVVYANDTQDPLENVIAEILGTEIHDCTCSDGLYYIVIPHTPTYQLAYRKEGYWPKCSNELINSDDPQRAKRIYLRVRDLQADVKNLDTLLNLIDEVAYIFDHSESIETKVMLKSDLEIFLKEIKSDSKLYHAESMMQQTLSEMDWKP